MSKTVRNLIIILVAFLLVDAGLLALLFMKNAGRDFETKSDTNKSTLTTYATTTTTAATVAEPSSAEESEADSLAGESESQEDTAPEVETPTPAIYTLTDDAPLLTDGLNEIYQAYKGDCFTGVPDAENPDHIRIDYMYDTKLISADKVEMIENCVVLPTAAVGQRGGNIDGFSACGPTAAAILVDWEKGEKTDKDELIKFTQEKELADQGSVVSRSGGMTSDKVIELISLFYEGKYNAVNVYNDTPAAKLAELIDTGHRALISVRYTGKVVEDWPTALVHFVIVCGYEDTEDGRYFYYADPFYGDGGRSLTRSSASLIETSMKNVKDEPQTILILE